MSDALWLGGMVLVGLLLALIGAVLISRSE